MRVLCGERGSMFAAAVSAIVCVFVALTYAQTVVGQKAVDLKTAYWLPQGFFISNVYDNGVLGANHTWSLTGGIKYEKALVNTEFYLFNLTYGRDASGSKVPPNFNSSQYFEINLLSTLPESFVQWNAYGYGIQVDLWPMRPIIPETNAQFAFQLVNEAKLLYIITSRLNSSLCVTTVRGGADFVLLECLASGSDSTQQFQLIDAFIPNPPPSVPGSVVDLSSAYYLSQGFFVFNVLDNAILGANHTWSLAGATSYDKAVASSQYYLFNLTYNRNGSSSSVPPSFTSDRFFEINLLSTLSDNLLQWNVYSYVDQVDLYPLKYSTPERNAQFSFQLVDEVNKVFVIHPLLDASYCVSTTYGGVDFVLKVCQIGNSAQRFQLINPGIGSNSGGSDNFFSTAGGVIVILIIIGVCLGGAYFGYRYWQKYSQTSRTHKSTGRSSQPELLTALNGTGGEQDEAHGSYRKIGDNMELGNVQDGNGHTAGM